MTKYKGKIQQIATACVQANLVSARSIYSGGHRGARAHDRDNLSLSCFACFCVIVVDLFFPRFLFALVDCHG